MAEKGEALEVVIEIDRDRCIGCLECIDVCPQSGAGEFPVYIAGEAGPEVANSDNCINCGTCEASCRAMAIRVGEGGSRNAATGGEVRAENKNRAMF
jgi:NAD-dependent dihydropyrimidine dehydrogenase PreA subunit